jgi:hypothetical protein
VLHNGELHDLYISLEIILFWAEHEVQTENTTFWLENRHLEDLNGEWKLDLWKIGCECGRGGWNWQKIMSDGGLIFSVVETLGSTTRELTKKFKIL